MTAEMTGSNLTFNIVVDMCPYTEIDILQLYFSYTSV